MAILIVDDSHDDLILMQFFLQAAGYDVLTANSMKGALDLLLNMTEVAAKIHLIVLDVLMPEDDGLRTCRRIKSLEQLHDIPIIMVSAEAEPGNVQLAFSQGAMDYIRKPIIKAELLARVRVVLKLREEMALRQAQAKQLRELTAKLEEADQTLQAISGVDALTGLLTWQRFDDLFSQEWMRAAQDHVPVSLIFFTVADFKSFNDSYGYLTGDECLQRIAEAAKQSVTGPRHLVARYRGAEFITLLPELDTEQAISAKEALRKHIENLDLGLCVHFGVATAHPNEATSRITLLALAKEALSHAKPV